MPVFFILNMEEYIRLNKYLSEAGVLSRRKADEAIAAGEISINGTVAELGSKVAPGDVVLLKASHSFEMHTILEDYMKKTGRGDEK